MSRANRIQYPGALYHITARGNRRANIFLDDRDHLIWFDVMAETIDRFGIIVSAFCHMPNHYHLLVQTPGGNLSASMQYLNGHYAQHFNKRHNLAGHVLQGRFHSRVVSRQPYLLELTRYIALNPVRAGLVNEAEAWRWSSHAATCGTALPLAWIDDTWLVQQFPGDCRARQVEAYRRFVAAGKGLRDPMAPPQKPAKRTPVALSEFARNRSRDAAIRAAYASGDYSASAIALHFGIAVKTVRRVLKG